MTIYVSLNEAKEQVAVDLDEDMHDARLERLIAAAHAWAENFINHPLVDLESSPPDSPPSIPEDAKSGLLLHVEFQFDRDPLNAEILLQEARNLLWPYREGLEV